MMAVPDHTLLRSWKIDFSALGYPEAEFRERLRLGNLWMNLAGLAYMTISMDGYLLATIYRISTSPPTLARRIPVEG